MNTENKPWISDKTFFWIVVALYLTVPALVTLLRYLPDTMRPSADFARALPKLNAIINSLVSVCLVAGVYFIRNKKDKATHQKFMLSAFVLSTLFLLSYVTYHYTVPHVPFCKEGWIKTVYLIILFSHIVLAAVIMPMILYTIYFSSVGKFAKHKKLARWTFPLWLYVSVTGVVVYLLLSPCLNT